MGSLINYYQLNYWSLKLHKRRQDLDLCLLQMLFTLTMTLYKHHLHTFGPGKEINTETVHNFQEREREREENLVHMHYRVILCNKKKDQSKFSPKQC